MTDKFESYAQAIRDLMVVDPSEYKRLVYEFAALFPAEFVSVVKKEKTVDEKVIDVFNGTNSVIEAIKEYRSLTGCGLKESKDNVENLLAKKGLRGDRM